MKPWRRPPTPLTQCNYLPLHRGIGSNLCRAKPWFHHECTRDIHFLCCPWYRPRVGAKASLLLLLLPLEEGPPHSPHYHYCYHYYHYIHSVPSIVPGTGHIRSSFRQRTAGNCAQWHRVFSRPPLCLESPSQRPKYYRPTNKRHWGLIHKRSVVVDIRNTCQWIARSGSRLAPPSAATRGCPVHTHSHGS